MNYKQRTTPVRRSLPTTPFGGAKTTATIHHFAKEYLPSNLLNSLALKCYISIYAYTNILNYLVILRYMALPPTETSINQKRAIMRNKPNLLNAQMNVSQDYTEDYENKRDWTLGENKPKTNPIRSQSNPIQTQSNPIKPHFSPFFTYQICLHCPS